MIPNLILIQKLINILPDDMIGEKNTAAPSNLFDTSNDEEAPLLAKKVKDLFHTITATALFISRVRQDLKLGTGFCCTRVKLPNETDYSKLSHMMKCLQKYASICGSIKGYVVSADNYVQNIVLKNGNYIGCFNLTSDKWIFW